MATVTPAAARVKPTTIADRVTMFLRDRGYDARTIEASRRDASLLTPGDAESVQRIVRDAVRPDPAIAARNERIAAAFLAMYGRTIETGNSGERAAAEAFEAHPENFPQYAPKPEPTPDPTPAPQGPERFTARAMRKARVDHATAAAAVAEGLASKLPTVDGTGLDKAEASYVATARNEALHRAGRVCDGGGFAFECSRVAEAVALRVVLARRPRPADPTPTAPRFRDADASHLSACAKALGFAAVAGPAGLAFWRGGEIVHTARTPREASAWLSRQSAPEAVPADEDIDQWAAAAFAVDALTMGLDAPDLFIPLAPVCGGGPDAEEIEAALTAAWLADTTPPVRRRREAPRRPGQTWTDADQYRHHGCL